MANPSILQEIPLIQKIYLAWMKREFVYAADRSKAILLINKNYATNQLKQSISGGAELQGENINGSFGANTKYAEVVEIGRKPGSRPPYQAILDWINRKIAIGHMQPPQGFTKSGLKKDQNALTGLAFIIAAKIGKRGTKPHPYLAPSFKILLDKFNQETPLELP